MTPDERSSFSNGIWLCVACARMIDRDIHAYPVELLRQWKALAETRAALGINKAAPREEDLQKQFVSALSGTPVLAPRLIANTHLATQTALEQLDPRFAVTTAYVDGVTRITAHARQPVALTLRVESREGDDIASQFDALAANGEPVAIDAARISVVGSKLIEHALKPVQSSGTGLLRFQAPKEAALMKILLRDPNGNATWPLDDVHGYVQGGYKQRTFFGKTFEGALDFRSIAHIDRLPEADASFQLDVTGWVGTEVLALPCFDDLCEFVRLISVGWVIDIQLKMKGKHIYRGTIDLRGMSEVWPAMRALLTYTLRVRKLAEMLDRSFAFELAEISAEDFEQLSDIVQFGEPGVTHDKGNLASTPVTGMLADAGVEGLRNLVARTEPAELVYVEEEAQTLMVYGRAVPIPRREFMFSAVNPYIDRNLDEVQEGDEVHVRWIPADGCTWSYRFIADDRLLEP